MRAFHPWLSGRKLTLAGSLILFPLVVLALASAQAPSPPTATERALRVETTEAAKEIKARLVGRGGRLAVRIGDFACPGHEGAVAGPLLRRLLGEELRKVGVAVENGAAVRVTGEVREAKELNTGRSIARLVFRPENEKGEDIGRPIRRTIVGGPVADLFRVPTRPLQIASASVDGTIKVWDEATGKEVLTLKGHTNGAISVAYRPDGKRIVSGGWDKTVKVWDAATGQETLSLKGHTNGARSVAYSPDGNRIVSGSFDNTLKVWDAATGAEALSLKVQVMSVAFSPDSKRIVSGNADYTVKVWNAATGKEVLTLKGHALAVLSVAFSADGKRIVSASMDKTVKVWDAERGQELLTLKGHTNTVTSVACSADGKRIVSASMDKTVKVWDAATGQERLTLKGHTDIVDSAAYSPSGKHIVSGSRDKTVRLWDAETGQHKRTFAGHTAAVASVAYRATGGRNALDSPIEGLRFRACWERRRQPRTQFRPELFASYSFLSARQISSSGGMEP